MQIVTNPTSVQYTRQRIGFTQGQTTKEAGGGWIIHGKKTHPKTIHSRIVSIDGKRVHCPQTTEAVRKYFDPDAVEFITQGKRKYLMPMDKKMKKQIAPLAKPYPKNEDWVKIDRKTFKMNNDTTKPV